VVHGDEVAEALGQVSGRNERGLRVRRHRRSSLPTP
jgi:hypothetical protein